MYERPEPPVTWEGFTESRLKSGQLGQTDGRHTWLQPLTTGGFGLRNFVSSRGGKRACRSGRGKLLLSGGNDGSSDLGEINGLSRDKLLLLPDEEGDLSLIVMTPEGIKAAGLARLF